MYGTIARIHPKRGQEKALVALMDEWYKVRRPKAKGSVAGYLFKPDKKGNGLLLVAVFKDEKSYRANAGDPEQDAWYRRLRKLLKADPEWEDGEYVLS